jgi:hypothetical protein
MGKGSGRPFPQRQTPRVRNEGTAAALVGDRFWQGPKSIYDLYATPAMLPSAVARCVTFRTRLN